MMGVEKYLKEKNLQVKLIGVQPDHPLHGIEGLKHMESALKPKIYQEELLDEQIYVSAEEAYRIFKKVLNTKGFLLEFLLVPP